MARASDQKMLGANLPSEFVENFWDKAVPEGVRASKIEVVIAMANAWVELPDDIKQSYLSGQKQGNNAPIKDMIEAVVEEKIGDLLNNPQKLKLLARSKIVQEVVLPHIKASAGRRKTTRKHDAG